MAYDFADFLAPLGHHTNAMQMLAQNVIASLAGLPDFWRMSEKRQIRCGGEDIGEHSIQQLYRAIMRGDFEQPLEFLSMRTNAWLPVSGLLEDFHPSEERIKDMRDAGITKAKWLGSGNGDDCPHCRAIANKVYPIDELPPLPLADCTCKPWCALTVIAVG
jgi:hypothetical protein